MINLLGWSGNVFFILATYLLGRKNILGFYSNILGNLFYMWQCIYLPNSALFWVSVMLIGVNIVAIIQWRRKC